jgi:hypothetical protein
MKRMCRESSAWQRELLAWDRLTRPIRIVKDPIKFAQLVTELEKRRHTEEEPSPTSSSDSRKTGSKAR